MFGLIGNEQSKTIIFDSFNRADSTTLGTSDTGQTWGASRILTGGEITISGNKAVATEYSLSGIGKGFDLGTDSYIVEFDIVALTNYANLEFRVTDANNRMDINNTATASQLRKIVAGVVTVLGEITGVDNSANVNIKFYVVNNLITVYRNNVLVCEVTEIFNTAVTWAEMLAKNASFDNFSVRRL